MLGTEANVRVLRELARHGGALPTSALIVRTGLAQSSVRTALLTLELLAAVDALGSGRTRLFRLNERHPLASAIGRLFEAEEARFDAIVTGLRTASEKCGGDIIAVWIYGSVARGDDHAGSDVDIAVVAPERTAQQRVQRALIESLRAAEDRLGFVASIVVLTERDVLRLDRDGDPWWISLAAEAIAVLGQRPDELVAARVAAAATKSMMTRRRR